MLVRCEGIIRCNFEVFVVEGKREATILAYLPLVGGDGHPCHALGKFCIRRSILFVVGGPTIGSKGCSSVLFLTLLRIST